MRSGFFCCLYLIGFFANAQLSYPPSVKVLSVQPKKQTADTIPPAIKELNIKSQMPENKMPNAIRNQQQLNLVYKGNNGAGFDLYQSTLDKMTVIRPDKTNMPTIGNSINHRGTLSNPRLILTDSISKVKKP